MTKLSKSLLQKSAVWDICCAVGLVENHDGSQGKCPDGIC